MSHINDLSQFQSSGLILKLLDGAISEEEVKQLDNWLAEDHSNIQYYVDFLICCVGVRKNLFLAPFDSTNNNETGISMRAELMLEAIEKDEQYRIERTTEQARKNAEDIRRESRLKAQEAFEKFKEEERRRQEKLAYKRYRTGQRRMIVSVTILAACFVLVFTVFFRNTMTASLPVPPVLPTPTASTDLKMVATITQVRNARWANTKLKIGQGTRLNASSLYLQSGMAQIIFDDGATVILQAPSEFEIVSSNKMTLRRGKLVAHVPPEAFGFVINTPEASIVDLGTEFGVEIGEEKQSDIYVFQGKVVLAIEDEQSPVMRHQVITKGQARRISAVANQTEIQEISFENKKFQRRMPRKNLIAYWNFDDDLSNVQGNTAYDGIAIGNPVISSEDVKVGIGALKIDNATGTDYVKIPSNVLQDSSIPFKNTVTAWYKYEDISGDGSDERNFLWETAPNSYSLSFAIRNNGDIKEVQWFTDFPAKGRLLIGSPAVNDGQWHHAAVVIDLYAKRLEFYHDGTLLDVENCYVVSQYRKSKKEFHIGNHREGDGSRNWDGYIDDVAIFNIALNSAQIKALYEGEYIGQVVNPLNLQTVVP
ncbi:MAG: FecR domain-containing protein [Sedimentisphaerales bacterium]|nr:FecR domain-containing protein [Sedimentisphaerales bacterium]